MVLYGQCSQHSTISITDCAICGLSARRTKSTGPKGLQLEVVARRALRLQVVHSWEKNETAAFWETLLVQRSVERPHYGYVRQLLVRRSTNSPPRWNHPSMPLPQQFSRCILCFILFSCICLAIVLCLPCIYLVFVLFLSFICLVFVLYLSCICQSMPLPWSQSDEL